VALGRWELRCPFVDVGNAADAVTLADITAARDVAGAVAKHTPVVSSVSLSDSFGHPVVLKAESLQRTGSFKIRGAMNKLASLGPLAKAGVTAGSAGNHAHATSSSPPARRSPRSRRAAATGRR
jgi:threonine dehydratase